MPEHLRKLALTTCCFLWACGGGDSSGGGGQSAVIPAPSPTPTPTPTAVAYTPNALPSASNAVVGLHQMSTFPGYSWSFNSNGVFGPALPDLASVGYDAEKTSTTIKLRWLVQSYLDAYSVGETETMSLLYPAGGIAFQMLRPGSGNSILPLEWTGIGAWYASNRIVIRREEPAGALVYGVPTPVGSMPGSGSYRFALWGWTPQDNITEGILILSHGGELVVDFGTRTVSGRIGMNNKATFDPASLTQVTFEPGIVADDGTFSGVASFQGGKASYRGRFNGPQAQELMIEWSYGTPTPPGKLATHGVLAGRR